MAYSSNLTNPYTAIGWDLHNIGVLKPDMSLVLETNAPFFSESHSDLSTGYLEDALVEWSDRCKRKRLLVYSDDQANLSNDLLENYWNSNCTGDPFEDFNYLSHISNANRITDEPINTSMSSFSDGATILVPEIKTPEEGVSFPETLNSSTSSNKDTVKTNCISSPEGGCQKKKKVITRVVYPFELVKPGGIKGDVTLDDINERILMPPTRPVRHPVGDFACRPCVSPDGPGLSGKAVVALTRIHTQGSGTITIIRTKD
ncbi:hypothetical protein HHK36_030197 [Tetracentron sinense]|uniref:Protein XRI1 n=1 Tax=Tetracentron sinense TaxID=13715 RepID=A0A834YAT1_TETSI|nr:hypothetical protein HHK36_030197 [Tetracentron sinense]